MKARPHLAPFAAAMLLTACNVDTQLSAPPESAETAILGPLTVEFRVLDARPDGVSWSDHELEDVSELRLGPDFVVLEQGDGSGVAFLATRVTELSWTRP